MSTQQEVVERALAYPYAIPARSFLLADEPAGGSLPFPEGPASGGRPLQPGDAETAGRAPLLAYGSNAAPEVLARKLGETTGNAPVVALRATLADFDVVYSAHISRYGSVPATLQRSPGTEATVFVLHLTAEQLRLVEATEPNYERVELTDVSCRLEGGETMTAIAAYRSRHGCLLVDGAEVALSAVEARARRFPAMTQPQVQAHLAAALDPGKSTDAFVLASASDPELARTRSARLTRTASTS